MSGRLKLRQAVKKVDARKVSVGNPISGILGIIMQGKKMVDVPGRAGFVYVRLRDNQNELIQAFNDKVSQVYDLPVLVELDEHYTNIWRVTGRDIGRYKEWQSSYVPRHANQHAFSGLAGAGGDVVWVYGNQFMPLLTHPSGSAGANNVVIEPFVYYYQGGWRYGGGTGTADILAYKPTGSNARMVLSYLDTNTNPALVASDVYFAATITGSLEIMPFLPTLPETSGIPLAGIRLVSGTSKILWSNIYDLRPIIASDGFIPTGAYGHIIQDEGVSLPHRPILNFQGTLVWAQDDSVNDRTNVVVSGSSGHIIQDEGVSLSSRPYLNFIGANVWAVDTGASTNVIISGGSAGHVIKDEGNVLVNRANLNFKGLGVWAVDNSPDTDIIISGSNEFASLAEAQAGVVESKAVAPNNLPLWVLGGALIRRDGYSGNARGSNSVDLQKVRSAATQVAAGAADVIAGGERNLTTADSYDSFIGGGYANQIADGECVIAGGNGNIISLGGYDSVIGGGSGNKIALDDSFIGGGANNYTSGSYAVVVAGLANVASASHTLAYGRQAKALHAGAKVISDNLAQDYPSLYSDEFAIRARGGFRVNTQINAGDGSVIETGTFSVKDGIGYFGGKVGVGSGAITPDAKLHVDGDARTVKNRITSEGGLAVEVLAGETLSRGNILYIAQDANNGYVSKNPVSGDMPVAAAYSDAVSGSYFWAVVSGIAYVLPESNAVASRGYLIHSSPSEAGTVKQISSVPLDTIHWKEVGHFLDNGAGTGTATRALLHFN